MIMKKTTLWKSFFLLCALIVGSMNVWADDPDYSYTLASGDFTTSSHSKTSGSLTWTCSNYTVGAGSESYGWDATYGFKFGSGNKSYPSAFTLTSSSVSSKIKKIIVKASVNSDKSCKLDVKVGSTTYGSQATINTKNDASWEFEVADAATINGAVELSFSSNTGPLYLSKIELYYFAGTTYTITPATNDENKGTVSLSGNKITASPKTGYRVSTSTPYSIDPANSATVVQNGNEFTITPSANTTVTINFEVIPTYTVTFDAGNGSCATASLTESLGGQGVTLPTATTSIAGWEFAGWAETAIANTTTIPTLFKAGSKYYPTAATTLHAVYTLSTTGTTYSRLTSLDQIPFAKKIAIASSKSTSKILNHNATSNVNAPTETNGEITATTDQMFALSGDNTSGYVLTGASGTLSQATLSASGSNDQPVDWSGTNNKWIIEINTNADNLFALRNANSEQVALEYDSGWKTYYVGTYTSSAYTAMKLYVPKTAYNSNPSAIITPTVAFEKGGTTLYLDAQDKTYTNTANVTGVSKTVTYTSSNTSVATVNASGVVTAVGIGTATITASVDAELGVSATASDTYDIVVKTTTSIAGIKALTNSSTAVTFSADLTDAVVTYVQGNFAYIQDATAAINVEISGHGLVAGKKINGAVSGTVKASYQIDQLTALDITEASVTDGGVIPAAEVKTLEEIKAAGTDYDGKLVTVNAVFISKSSTTTTLTDGSKIGDEEVSFTLYSPNSAVSVNNQEKGNFTGFVSIFNGITYRLNLYEQSKFVKTHNAPQNQDMTFATAAYNLDEETDAVTDFAGQAVTETTVKGTLTYSIKAGSNDIITSLNASTGAVVLNGACGTATIVATAAAYDEYDEGTGYYTPYKELTKEYCITVRPRYSVTFSINGNTDEVRRQTEFGAAITAPDVASIGDYEFQGWSDTEVSKTNTKPTMTTGNSITPTTNKTVYAVYAIKTQTGTTDVEDQSYSKSAGTLTVGGTYTANTGYYLLHEGGYVESNEFDLSIITKVVVYGGTYGGSEYNRLTIGDGTNKWKDVTVTGSSNTGTNEFTGGNALSGTGKLRITSTCGGTTNGVRVSGFKIYKSAPVYDYSNYTTAFNVDINIPASGYLSYCSPYKLDFSETNVKAYTASVDNAGTVTLTKVDVVPAEEGVVLFSSEAQTANEAKDYTVPVTAEDASDVTGNQMVGVLTRTQVEWNPSDGIYNYILQQGEFRKATTPGGYLKANRAYLSTSYNVTAAGARPLTIVFEGETTRISNVDVNDNFDDNAPMYNLAGQKVGKSYKGIVIQNGKKVVRK